MGGGGGGGKVFGIREKGGGSREQGEGARGRKQGARELGSRREEKNTIEWIFKIIY